MFESVEIHGELGTGRSDPRLRLREGKNGDTKSSISAGGGESEDREEESFVTSSWFAFGVLTFCTRGAGGGGVEMVATKDRVCRRVWGLIGDCLVVTFAVSFAIRDVLMDEECYRWKGRSSIRHGLFGICEVTFKALFTPFPQVN